MRGLLRGHRATSALAGAVAAAVLAGCAGSTPAPMLLTLPPAVVGAGPAIAVAAAEPRAASEAASGVSGATSAPQVPLLAIRRVDIPEYMVARRVRFRADASTLAEWPNTGWAERIEIGVAREFGSALRQQLPGWALCEDTCGDQLPTLALQVNLLTMDFVRTTAPGLPRLQARARFTVSATGASPHVLRTDEQVYDLPARADTAQAEAEALTELMRRLSVAAAPLVRDAQR